MLSTALESRFWISLILLAIPIVSGLWWAIENDWFFPLSPLAELVHIRKFPGTTHFFPVAAHLGWWASIPLAALLAWAFAESWPRWNVEAAVFVLLLSVCIAITGMVMWAKADNDPDPAKHVLSAFATNGKLTFAGWCLGVEMILTYAIATMYFISPGPANALFPLVFAIALTVALAVGLLQPPYYVWGKIHSAAWTQSVVFGALVWILFCTHKLGFVIHA